MDNVANPALRSNIIKLAKAAKLSNETLRSASTAQKNKMLTQLAGELRKQSDGILRANQTDVTHGIANGLDAALVDRLTLNVDRIDAMIESVEQIAALPDPVGEISDLSYRPSGIQVGKMRVPLGVIGMIYESRPNVTIDATALCLKSGNSVILKGGSEAINSNKALLKCVQAALSAAGLGGACVQLVENTSRQAVIEMIQLNDYIDIIIPRGGKGLVEAVTRSSKVPVIQHLHGICHTYIDKDADVDMAESISLNAKTRRYGVCNAMETLLVHEQIAEQVLPPLIKRYQDLGVEIRGCERTQALGSGVIAAIEEDWHTEYLAAILSVRVVDSIDEAMAHIARYGSNHSDAIVTNDYHRGRLFMTQVDSSSVLINASTGFADGFEYGLGAEIGISTNKLHVRGPVGLTGLTSEKFVVFGEGQIRP